MDNNINKLIDISTTVNTFDETILFSDKKLKSFDKPYIILNFDNIPISELHINKIKLDEYNDIYNIPSSKISKKTDNKQNNKQSDIIDKVNIIINNVSNNISAISHIIDYSNHFLYPYFKKIMHHIIMYFKNTYSIQKIKNIYMYTNSYNNPINMTLKQNFTFKLNKKIKKIDNFYMLIFYYNSNIFKNYSLYFNSCIIDAINKLKSGGTIILGYIFAPQYTIIYQLYLLFLYCFHKVTFIYTKYTVRYQNFVYIVLQDKKNNINIPSNCDYYNITYKLNKDTEYDIKHKFNSFLLKIFNHIDYNVGLFLSLLKLKNDDLELYYKMNYKIMEKINNLFTQ